MSFAYLKTNFTKVKKLLIFNFFARVIVLNAGWRFEPGTSCLQEHTGAS